MARQFGSDGSGLAEGGTALASNSRLPAITLPLAALTVVSAAILTGPHVEWALAPALAVVALVVIAEAPVLGFYGIVALIPFAGFRKIEGAVPLNLPWILAILLVAVLGARIAASRRLPSSLRSGLWPWLLGWLAVSLISAAASPYPTAAMKNLAILAAAVLFVAVGMLLLTPDRLRGALPVLLVASVGLSSLLGLVGQRLGLASLAETHGERLIRGIGGAIDPNNLSLMILYVFPLLAYGLVWARSRTTRVACGALLVLQLAAIGSTYSRGGAVMLAVTALLLGIEHRRLLTPRNIGLVATGLAVALFLVLTLVPSSYWERQSSLARWEDRSLSRRVTYLAVAWDSVRTAPVLGSGPGTFRERYAASEESRRFALGRDPIRRYAHNSYLEVLVGTGLLGLFLFLGALAWAQGNFTRAIRRLEADGNERDAALVRSYRLSFVIVVFYLLIFSDVVHKDLLLSLAVSQAVLRLPLAGAKEVA